MSKGLGIKRFILVSSFLSVSTFLFAQTPIVIRNDKPLQSQMQNKNTVYIIRNSIDLKGGIVSIPADCTVLFEGGELKNGTLEYNNTYLEGNYKILCSCKGTVANDIVEPHMYGARSDGQTDDAYSIQQAINSGKQVLFRRGTYLVGRPIVFDRQNFLVDFNFATLKKDSKTGYNYKYKDFDFAKIPCVILFKPYESNTSGHIVLKNLIIEGGGVNVGIHAVWCRNVILDNIRVLKTTQGFVYSGFTNTFRDITIWDSKEGFVLIGGNASLFERCFSSGCGWRIDNSSGLTMTVCSSDDFNPCYKISNSTVTMVGCTFESKGIGMDVDNSVVNINGDFESHIYDSTKSLTYIKANNNSIIKANSCLFHLNNYLSKKVPVSPLFVSTNNSSIQIEGIVEHSSKEIQVKSMNGGTISLNGSIFSNGKNILK